MSETLWLKHPEHYVVPQWRVPENIRAVSTSRLGGVSGAPYDTFNLGGHVRDRDQCVRQNRRRLADDLGLPGERFFWLNQTHSSEVVDIDDTQLLSRESDGSTTTQRRQACVVMTADCLPILLTNTEGRRVSAIHAGWRGLCGSIVENGVSCFSDASEVIAWLGPAIGPNAFEVGRDVYEAFLLKSIQFQSAFTEKSSNNKDDKWLADIHLLATISLQMSGVQLIYASPHCTYSESGRFFSYRREGETGRMATAIWMV